MLEGCPAPSSRMDALTDPCLETYNSPYQAADRPVHRASVRICLQEMTTQVHLATSNTAQFLLLTAARGLRWVFIGTQRHVHWVVLRGITREHPRTTYPLLCCPKFANINFLKLPPIQIYKWHALCYDILQRSLSRRRDFLGNSHNGRRGPPFFSTISVRICFNRKCYFATTRVRVI